MNIEIHTEEKVKYNNKISRNTQTYPTPQIYVGMGALHYSLQHGIEENRKNTAALLPMSQDFSLIQSRASNVRLKKPDRILEMLENGCDIIFGTEPRRRDGQPTKGINLTTGEEHTILRFGGEYQTVPTADIIEGKSKKKK